MPERTPPGQGSIPPGAFETVSGGWADYHYYEDDDGAVSVRYVHPGTGSDPNAAKLKGQVITVDHNDQKSLNALLAKSKKKPEGDLGETLGQLAEGEGVAPGQESSDDLDWLGEDELQPSPDVFERMEEGEELDPDDVATLAENLEEAGVDTAQVRSGLSEELQEALSIAEGTKGEAERFAAGTIGWSALQQVPFLAEYAFGAGKRARQQRRALESEVPQGLSEAQEQAFAAQEAGVGARSREWRMRQQSLEASKGKQVSARDLQRTRDAMRKELEEGATKIGLTKTITDITLENKQEAQIQSDLDQLAQFQTMYFRNLIGTPLGKTIGSVGEFHAKRAAHRAAPDVESSIEKLREQGVSDEHIAGMLFLALEKRPAERKKYLSEIATAYTSLGDEGEARARNGAEAPEEEVSVAAAQEATTANVPDGETWVLPGNPPGKNLSGPFTLYAPDGKTHDGKYQYYWNKERREFIAFPWGGSNMTPISRDNAGAIKKLQDSHNLWLQSQQQGE